MLTGFTSVHETRRNGQEHNALLSVLCVKLGNDHVESCFGDGVRHRGPDGILPHHVPIAHCAAQNNDLLGLTSQDEG